MQLFSVVIIVKQRRQQLRNLLDSINKATLKPFDIQIICMDAADDLRELQCANVHIHELDSPDALPLAAARNRGARETLTDTIIFVDVDCIVSPTLFATMLTALKHANIVAAYPLYLPTVPENGNYTALHNLAVPHPARVDIPAGVPVAHLDFWSIIFAVNKQTFDTVGGFDETFTGYGAEDTDFAMSFNKAGIVQVFAADYVLHQYHDKYDPPLNHFDAIISNAERYLNKWGTLPMGRWLRLFSEQGLIRIDDQNHITKLRSPTTQEVQANVSKQPY